MPDRLHRRLPISRTSLASRRPLHPRCRARQAWCAQHDENPLHYDKTGEANFNHVRVLAEGHWIRPELAADQPERAMVQIRQLETLNAQDRSATAYLPGAELVVFNEDPTKGLWSVVLEFAGPCELLAVASAMIHAAALFQAAEPIEVTRH